MAVEIRKGFTVQSNRMGKQTFILAFFFQKPSPNMDIPSFCSNLMAALFCLIQISINEYEIHFIRRETDKNTKFLK